MFRTEVDGLDLVARIDGMVGFAKTLNDETLLAIAVFALSKFDEVFNLVVIAAMNVVFFHYYYRLGTGS